MSLWVKSEKEVLDWARVIYAHTCLAPEPEEFLLEGDTAVQVKPPKNEPSERNKELTETMKRAGIRLNMTLHAVKDKEIKNWELEGSMSNLTQFICGSGDH